MRGNPPEIRWVEKQTTSALDRQGEDDEEIEIYERADSGNVVAERERGGGCGPLSRARDQQRHYYS